MDNRSEASNKIINFIRKEMNMARDAAKAIKAENDFVNNYRAIINDQAGSETSDFTIGTSNDSNELKSNKITFRNARVGEKTGLQKISLLKSNGDKEDIFLIVPERESVGYGEIRGWNSPGDQNMPLTKGMWENAVKSNIGRPDFARETAYGFTGMATPFTAIADALAGNTIANNVTKNERSNYTGPDKAVGLGNADQSEGQIFGMITSDGEMMAPQETRSFLTNLKKNGYKGIAEIEQPKKVQEHTGPAYVPGDILLGLLGLQPNRGAVGYTFEGPATNTQYRSFVDNIRKARGTNR